MRLVWLPAIALVLALGAPAHAASPSFQPFPQGSGTPDASRPESDGLRYVVINAEPGVVRVFDTESKTARDVAVRPECTMRGVTVNFALVGCTDDPRPFLLRLRTGAMRAVGPSQAPADFEWFDIGRNWIQGGYHYNRPVTVYENWRTGEDGGSYDGFEGPALDLDAPKLTEYSRSHSVFVRNGSSVLKDVLGRNPRHQRLVLVTAGGGRVLLSDCVKGCHSGRLSAGLASWAESESLVLVYDALTHRRLRLTADEPGTLPRFMVGHTRRYVVAGLASDQPPYTPHLVWARVRR